MMARAIVLIDGSNFYFRLKDLTSKLDGKFSLLEFDFGGFSKWLARAATLVETRYYVGAVRRQNGNAKSDGKRVIYVGADKGLSFGLTKTANELIVMKAEDIRPFLGKRPV